MWGFPRWARAVCNFTRSLHLVPFKLPTMHTTKLYMHAAYSYTLNEQGTQHCSLQSSIDPYLPCSAAMKFHDITSFSWITVSSALSLSWYVNGTIEVCWRRRAWHRLSVICGILHHPLFWSVHWRPRGTLSLYLLVWGRDYHSRFGMLRCIVFLLFNAWHHQRLHSTLRANDLLANRWSGIVRSHIQY